tara:strand:- start:424 stop:594 length:171 start_codon:yes stop_codon:yes gene_type:complete
MLIPPLAMTLALALALNILSLALGKFLIIVFMNQLIAVVIVITKSLYPSSSQRVLV